MLAVQELVVAQTASHPEEHFEMMQTLPRPGHLLNCFRHCLVYLKELVFAFIATG